MTIYVVIALDEYGSALMEGFVNKGDAMRYLDSLDLSLKAWVQEVKVNV